jgi:hypothetical protein
LCGKHTVSLVLVVTSQETVGVVRHSRVKKPKYLSTCDREDRGSGEGVVYMCERVDIGTGRVEAGERYLDCHIH